MNTIATLIVRVSYPSLLIMLAGSMILAHVSMSAAQLASFSAVPQSGPAPLAVKFCASAGVVIDFGDGTHSGMGAAAPGECPAGLNSYVSHTYTIPGEYRLSAL